MRTRQAHQTSVLCSEADWQAWGGGDGAEAAALTRFAAWTCSRPHSPSRCYSGTVST